MSDEGLTNFIHNLLDKHGLNVVEHGAVVARTRLREALDALIDKHDCLQQWVNDLQAGMFINCVYCGHRYGPDDEVPESMADVLKEHIEQCPEHPMSKIKKQCEILEGTVQTAIDAIEDGENLSSGILRQQFGMGFVNMLKESLKGGYRDAALDFLRNQIERQKELITRKDEEFEEAREKNEALVRGLEDVREKLKSICTSCSKDFNGSRVHEIERLAMDAGTVTHRLLSDDPEGG